MSHLMTQSINLYNQLAKNKLFSKSVNFDLKRIKLILQKLNYPEKKLKNVINIIGSDGKYSLLTSLKYFIEANHKKTSAYISPSLKDIRERFWMGSNFLSYKEIKKTIKIIEKQKINLTIFEALTVIFVLNVKKIKYSSLFTLNTPLFICAQPPPSQRGGHPALTHTLAAGLVPYLSPAGRPSWPVLPPFGGPGSPHFGAS